MDKESHLERTAAEPWEESTHTVRLAGFRLVGPSIRVFRLNVPAGAPDVVFRPGQWVDCFCPGITKAGGFTLTSAPSAAVGPGARHLELAVRRSPDNPAAAWLWREGIVGCQLKVRVGGSFVYPPVTSPAAAPPQTVTLVAGGVGINPLMSMLSAMAEQPDPPTVHLLYSARESTADDVLFLDRIAGLFAHRLHGSLQLFLTAATSAKPVDTPRLQIPCHRRRIATADLDKAVPDHAYVYICGVPAMTDAFVTHLLGKGIAPQHVLYEKWW